jgi:hypothetical protein
MRATHLLIPNHIEPDGGERCCICRCTTSAALKGRDYFGETFRDYREMQDRLSPYICSMCALSLKDVPGGVVTYLDGTTKTPRSEKRGDGLCRHCESLAIAETRQGCTKTTLSHASVERQ